MELEYEKPNIPNFVRTKQGTFPLGDLSEEDVKQLGELWASAIMAKHKELKEKKAKEQNNKTHS